MKSNLKNYVSLWELQDEAVRRLPGLAKDYYQSGSEDEYALRENERMYRELRLRYRVLQKMDEVDTSTRVLGSELSFPLYIAPAAFQCMAHAEGEIATARAAADRAVGFCLSTLATQPMEKVAAVTEGSIPLWFQLYMYKDQGRTRELLQRAKSSGYQAIALTVDAPAWGKREVDIHNGFHLPHGMWIRNV
ncbi:MAG: alpha-hydroxy-acid oxidizing protein, partial [Spirochaetaceae bacterium]